MSQRALEAIKSFVNAPRQARSPSFYGTRPSEDVQRQFGQVLNHNLLGAAEAYAEENHPLYTDVAAAFAQRLPWSVVCKARAGTL